MRSFLTMLGIIIGVSAVIAMVAISEGAKAQVEGCSPPWGRAFIVIGPAPPARAAGLARNRHGTIQGHTDGGHVREERGPGCARRPSW
jgi:hypothetical protein